jgi:hypothetical protein
MSGIILAASAGERCLFSFFRLTNFIDQLGL